MLYLQVAAAISKRNCNLEIQVIMVSVSADVMRFAVITSKCDCNRSVVACALPVAEANVATSAVQYAVVSVAAVARCSCHQ